MKSKPLVEQSKDDCGDDVSAIELNESVTFAAFAFEESTASIDSPAPAHCAAFAGSKDSGTPSVLAD